MNDLRVGLGGGYVPSFGGRPGRWLVVVEGGPAFMANAALSLAIIADALPPDSGKRDVVERLQRACEEALDG